MVTILSLVASLGSMTAHAVDIETYKVAAPANIVAGATTLSANIGGNTGSAVQKYINDGLTDSRFGYRYSLLGKRKDFPIFEKEVDIRTLQAVTSGGDIGVNGQANGRSQIVQKEDKVVTRDEKQVTLKCFAKQAEVQYNVEVTSGGAILDNLSDTQTVNSGKACDENPSTAKAKLPSDQDMYVGVARRVAVDIVASVKPVYRKVTYSVKANKNTKKLLKDMKKNKNVGPAIDDLAEIVESDPYDVSASISLGIAYEMFGDATSAIAQFEKAVKLDEKKAGSHLERAESRAREVAALGELGLDVVAGLPEAGAGRVVAVKGSPGKRIPVTAEPGGGETIAMVPGKLKLTVKATSGKYLLVETPDGKQGYVAATSVK